MTPATNEPEKKTPEAPLKFSNFNVPSDEGIEFFQDAAEKKETVVEEKPPVIAPQSPLEKMGNTLITQDPFALYQEGRNISARPVADASPQNQPERIQTFMSSKYSESPIKPLRTYRGDVEEAMKGEKTSVVTIVLAQKKKEEHSEQIKKQGAVAQNVFVSFLTVVLVIAGIGSVTMFLYVKSQQQRAVSTFYKQRIVPADKEVSVDVSVGGLMDIVGNMHTLEIQSGELVLFRLLKGEGGVELSPQEAALLLDSKIPGNLLRSFSSNYMFGVYREKAPTPFFIVKTDSFETAFSGLLSWEKTFPLSAGELFALGTAPQISFEDKVVKNKDTRILKNQSGQTVILYAFLDSETIIFTGNEAVFGNLLDRYFNSKFVR